MIQIERLCRVAVCLVAMFAVLAVSASGDVYSTGDPNCSGSVDIDDVVYLIAYIFGGGPAPCNPSPPSGEVIGGGECKYMMKGVEPDTFPTTLDCIDYTYDGESVLDITHINAGLNCCPVFVAEFSVEDNLIIIEEIDSLDNGGCDCNCLFDIDYQISNLPPAVYTIKVIEPYMEPSEDTLQFEADLTTATSGIYCVERHYYPWGI